VRVKALSLAAHLEYLADARAVRLVEARQAVREARAAYDAAKRADLLESTRSTLAALEESEFLLCREERALRALSQTTRGKPAH
jgi:hypothetical protein